MNENLRMLSTVAAVIAIVVLLSVIFYNAPEVVVEDDLFGDFNPISTEARAIEYTNELMTFPCEGLSPGGFPLSFRSSIPYDQEMNEYGLYGNRATTMIDGMPTIVGFMSFSECFTTEEWYDENKTTPKSGHMVFQLNFDPNNGYIMQQTCNYIIYPDYCPKYDNGSFVFIPYHDWKDNPNSDMYSALPYTGR